MSQQLFGSLTASLFILTSGATAALSQTLPTSENVAVSQPTAEPAPQLTRVFPHTVAGAEAATLYIRSIPFLTFVATTAQSNPEEQAKAIGDRLSALAADDFDANTITVAWDKEREIYRITGNGEELAILDGKQTVLPDTTRNITQDAIQATNRLRRLLGGAAPLQADTLELRPVAIIPQEPDLKIVSTQRGIASWYGPGFHGRLSASGERFNQNAMTAAHRTLPFGTRVRVTNRNNGRSVIVRINDRGPFIRGRVIDLSVAAAKRIGMYGSGIAPVQVEVLGR